VPHGIDDGRLFLAYAGNDDSRRAAVRRTRYPPPVRAPRPVAGLPALDPAELAKAWLLELIAAAPLEQAAHVRVAELTREAPAICAAMLAALADDDALVALEMSASRAAALAGASDAIGVLAATEALRAATTRALRAAIQDEATAHDVTDRLAHLTTRVAQASLVTLDDAGVPADPIAVDPIKEAVEGGEPFVLLAVEIVDRERWQTADPEAIQAATTAIERNLRPGDRLIAEQPGRYMLIAPSTDVDQARELATILAEAAEQAGPAAVAFGIAACPHDGIDAEALTAHADEALLSALAAGRPVA
jgi:hypothetical protein